VDVHSMGFRGFWSQGDGAWCNGHTTDWEKALAFFNVEEPEAMKKLREFTKCEPEFSWSSDQGRYHSRRVDLEYVNARLYVDVNDELQRFIAKVLDDDMEAAHEALEEALDEAVGALCDKLYAALAEEYWYLTGDEAVWDLIVVNELHEGQCDCVTESEDPEG